MLKVIKSRVLGAASALGVTRLAGASRWRRQRLLILCYHGIEMEDENAWRPELYLRQPVFARRMELIRESGCAVLPLGESLSRLYAGTLPPRSVVLTFDDGGYDFYRLGYPLLRKYGYPATVYLTTYYADYNRPVFDVALAYLLWKMEGRDLEWAGVLPAPVRLDPAGAKQAFHGVQEYCLRRALSGKQKDELLADLAAKAGIDYEALCRRRLLTLMNPDEVREMAAAGIDFQMHTHRHRVYRDKERTLRELEDNQQRICAMTGTRATHLCYPSGTYLPEFLPWFRSWGMESAATCVAGLASRESEPLLLPRLVDVPTLSELEFRSWLNGIASLLPRRNYAPSYWSLKDE